MLVVRNLPANAGDIRDLGLVPGLGRSPGGGHDNHMLLTMILLMRILRLREIRPLGQDHTADKERFQPWASVNPSHSTILLLCILQLGDTAEWDLGSRGRVRAAYNWKVVYSFTCLEGVALSAGRACSCGQKARGGPSCKDSLRLKCWALTGQDGWERWA